MNVLTIIATGVGLLVIVGVATLLLPRKVHIERQSTLNASVESIIELAASNKGYQAFNPYLTADPDLNIRHFGPDQRVGSGFYFDGKDGKGKQTVAQLSQTSVTYNIDLGSMGQPIQQINAQPTSNGVIVTWSMDMDFGYKPFVRIFGLFMDKMVGNTFEQGLKNLDQTTQTAS